MAKSAQTIAEFEDRSGRPHKVVLMADRLLIDIVGTEPPRVLALMRHDEGIEQAKAIVLGIDGEEGYAARAKRERAPLCRPLERGDLETGAAPPRPAEPDDDWPAAA